MDAVLLIEDDETTARLIVEAFRDQGEEYAVTVAPSARAGLTRLGEQAFACVLLDYRLPDADGLSCLREIRARHPDVPVVMVTGAGSEEVAVEALRLGASNYVRKHGRYLAAVPVAVRAELGRRELLEAHRRKTHALDSAQRELARLQRELRERYAPDGIIGQSPAMLDAVRQIEIAAPSVATVLLEGETGTGKELFARAVHFHGPRAARPFIPVNCAALPEHLLEDELFGHVRGAFTGADRARPGLFAEADGGTLFLDEVSELSPVMQAKLLRVVQEREVRPLGSDAARKADVRLIAATNRPLKSAVDGRTFRRDLFFRLSVFPIHLPPLRERREDVRLLAEYFLERLGATEGRRFRGFEARTCALLTAYDWPGNVRELQSEVHRLVLSARGYSRIPPHLLSPAILEAEETPPLDGTLEEIRRRVDTAVIEERIRRCGSQTQAARSLGVSREWLWQKRRRLGLAVPDDKDE